MRNGPYILVVAPEDYPGKKYRGRYVYKHILVFWKNTGRLPLPDHVIHHKNDDKHDNKFDNLEEKHKGVHSGDHSHNRGKLIHGTLNAYDYYKCRCIECKAAKSNYANERRLSKGIVARVKKELIHGTRYTYNRIKCKCDECCEANTEYSRKYRLGLIRAT